jgi:hypothetical protein
LRDTAIFGRGFLDGFTMAGFVTKLTRPGAVNLDRLLTAPSITVEDIQAAERDDQRTFRYAMIGLLCGFIAFLGCLGSYVYLALHDHEVIAGIVLGLWFVVAIADLARKYFHR